MKQTIFRLTTAGLTLAAVIALGAAAGIGQTPAPTPDPCADAAGIDAMQNEFDTLYADKVNMDVRQKAIDSGKAFLAKYGACTTAAKTRADWLKTSLPDMEKKLADRRKKAEVGSLVDPFDAALRAAYGGADAAAKAKGFDDAFNLGPQILAKWPEGYRTVEITLAAMAGDEAFLRQNYKFADAGLRYAKQSIADLEANKNFAINGEGDPAFGLTLVDKKDKSKVFYNYGFKDHDTALGWMNLYVGNILFNSKKDKPAALPYLFKATQLVKENPSPYATIGYYYFDQLGVITAEVAALIASQNKPGITEDEIKSIIDQIKAKTAISNGVAERAMDAFARAYTLSTDAAFKTKMKGNVANAYKVRYGATGPITVDQFIATASAKPFVNPTTPVTPIADPEPVKTTTGTTATPASVTTTTTTTTTVAKPVVTAPAKTQAPTKTTTATKKPGVAKKAVAKKSKRG